MTVDGIIDSLGGTTQVASALSVAKSTVSTWRARRSIPPEYWSALVRLDAGRNEVTLEGLAALSARPEEVRA
jgi:hypothetical protein